MSSSMKIGFYQKGEGRRAQKGLKVWMISNPCIRIYIQRLFVPAQVESKTVRGPTLAAALRASPRVPFCPCLLPWPRPLRPPPPPSPSALRHALSLPHSCRASPPPLGRPLPTAPGSCWQVHVSPQLCDDFCNHARLVGRSLQAYDLKKHVELLRLEQPL